jgi:integrase
MAELRTEADVFKLSLPTGSGGDAAYFDKGPRQHRAKGLALRVRKDGSRTWVFFYRTAGKLRRFTIGTASNNSSGWTLAKARTTALRLRADVKNGLDPVSEHRETEARAKESIEAKTFKEVADAYLLTRQRDMKPRSHAECARHLNTHWKTFHKLPAHTVDADVIAERLKEIEADSGPVARNRARSTLGAMFRWAVIERQCKQLKINPVKDTGKTEENGSRVRTLTDRELAAIWRATPDTGYGRIIRLLMLTAQRRDEIGGLRWSEVDVAAQTIGLPGERTKNRLPHDIPLSKLALGVLADQPKRRGRDLVFGEGEGGFSGWSRSKDRLDAECGVKDWTLHDLRRTAATGMANLGVQPHIIEAVLNHISGHKAGVAGIYNRSTYAADKRAALELWANHIKTVATEA